MRCIFHIDMDAFFASVEQRDNPELRGKPIAVGGSGRRGVVAAASYEAREFGVRSAMPGSRALRLCPELIFVKHRFDAYKEASSTIRKIFMEVTDLVEPLSLDEAYLDMSHYDYSWEQFEHLALNIKERIRKETELTASAGISFNKFLAKMASDVNKPDGLTVIRPVDAVAFIDALPIEKFYGVGNVTAARMHNHGIRTGADLRLLTELELATRYGKMGRYLYKVVRGQDDRDVKPHRERKSISVERTFEEDINSKEALDASLEKIAVALSERLKRTERSGHTIILKVRFRDFTTLTRQMKISAFSTDPAVLKRQAYALLEHVGKLQPIRLLGLGITDLDKEDRHQLRLDIW